MKLLVQVISVLVWGSLQVCGDLQPSSRSYNHNYQLPPSPPGYNHKHHSNHNYPNNHNYQLPPSPPSYNHNYHSNPNYNFPPSPPGYIHKYHNQNYHHEHDYHYDHNYHDHNHRSLTSLNYPPNSKHHHNHSFHDNHTQSYPPANTYSSYHNNYHEKHRNSNNNNHNDHSYNHNNNHSQHQNNYNNHNHNYNHISQHHINYNHHHYNHNDSQHHNNYNNHSYNQHHNNHNRHYIQHHNNQHYNPHGPNIEDSDGDGHEEEDIWTGNDFASSIVRVKRKAADSTQLWPDAVVPYAFRTPEPERGVIMTGLNHWEEHTCLRFLPVNDTHLPHLQFRRLSGCRSGVGIESSSGQNISIGDNCNKMGIVVHEVGHAVGLYHEIRRPDRDQHVVVNEDNILKQELFNFYKLHWLDVSIQYDLSSVMHYHTLEWSANERTTVATRDPMLQGLLGRWKRGHDQGLSHRDRLLANKIYGCLDKWLVKCNLNRNPCENEGYLGRDCNCVCPPGTHGRTCQTVTAGYYDHLKSPCSREVTYPTVITSPNYPRHYDGATWCVYRLQAPECHAPQVTVWDFQLGPRDHRGFCHQDYLEIRNATMHDGFLVCGSEIAPGTTWTSSSSTMILYLKGEEGGFRGFKAQVTFVGIPGCCRSYSNTTEAHFLHTPGYPNPYTRPFNCSYSLPQAFPARVEVRVLRQGGGGGGRGSGGQQWSPPPWTCTLSLCQPHGHCQRYCSDLNQGRKSSAWREEKRKWKDKHNKDKYRKQRERRARENRTKREEKRTKRRVGSEERTRAITKVREKRQNKRKEERATRTEREVRRNQRKSIQETKKERRDTKKRTRDRKTERQAIRNQRATIDQEHKRKGRNTDESTRYPRPKRKALRNERKERRQRRIYDDNNSAPFSVLLPNVASIHHLQYLGGASPFRAEGVAYQVSFTILESPCHQKLFVNRSDPRGWVEVMARGNELLQCEWWIQAPHGSHIRLTVEELILPTDERSYLAVNEAGDPSYPRDTTRVYQGQGMGEEGEGGFWTGRGRGSVGNEESWTRHGRSSIILERGSTGHGSNSARHKKGWSERGKGRTGNGRASEGRGNKSEGQENQPAGNRKGTIWRILQAPTPMIVSLDHNLSLVLQGQGPNASIVFKYELYDCGDDNPECPYWTADGECDVNPGWMKPHCRKSCFTCDYSVRCEDEHGDCQFWANHDQCGENQRWMAVHCRRACGHCGGCQDASGGCQRWVGRGECHRNPRYMARFCPRACRFCESQDSTSSNITTQHTANTTRQTTTTTIIPSRDLPTAKPPPWTTATTTTSPRQNFPAIHTHRKSPSGRRNATGRNDEENETTRGIKTDFHLKPRKFKPNSFRPWPSKRTRNPQHNGRVHVRQENTRVSTRVPKNKTDIDRIRVHAKKPTFPRSSNSNQFRNSVYGEGEHDTNISNTTTTSNNFHTDLQHSIANNSYQIAFSTVYPFLRSTTTDLGNEQKSTNPERVDTHSPSQTPRPMETNITSISSHVNNEISIPPESYRARDTTSSRPEMMEEEERTKSLKSEYNTHGLNNEKQMLSFEDCEDGGVNAERCVAGFNWTSSTKETQDFIKGLIRNQHLEDSNPQVTDENDVAITTNAGEPSGNINALSPNQVQRHRNHSHKHRNRNHRPNNRVLSPSQRSRKHDRINYLRKRGRWRTRKPNNEHDNAQGETGNIGVTQGSRMVDRPTGSTENTRGRSGRRHNWRGGEERDNRQRKGRRGTQDTRRREEQERMRERRMRQRDRRQGRQRKSSSTRRNENQDSRRFETRIGDFPIRVSPTTTIIPFPFPRISMTTPAFPTHPPPTTHSHAPLALTHTSPTTPHLARPGQESSSTIPTTISTLTVDGRRQIQERRRNHKQDVIEEGNLGDEKHGVTERRPPTNAINQQTNHHFSNLDSVNTFPATPSKRTRPRKQDVVGQGARQRNHQRKQKRRRGRKNRKSHSRDQRGRRKKQQIVSPSQHLEESEIRQHADSSRFLQNQSERRVPQKTQNINNQRENSDNQQRLKMDRSSSDSTLQYPDRPPVHYGPPAHHHLNLTSIADTQMEDTTRKTNHSHHTAEENQNHPEQLNRDRKLQHSNTNHEHRIVEDNHFNPRHPERLRKDNTNRHSFGQDSASKTNLGQYITEENQLNQRHPDQSKMDRNTLHSFNQESEFPWDERRARDQVTSSPETYAEWGIGPLKPSHQSYGHVRPWWRYRRGFYRRGKDVYEDVRARLHD